jgi:DNA polymerase elongation subunit (family B)
LDLKIDTGLHPLLIEARDLAVLRRECSKRWTKVQDQVLKFLGSCKSLNEAIKLWPDVRRYIPKDYLKRVDTKVEKTKTKSSGADALAGMDMDMVNTSLVLARMAGASL